MKSLFSFAKTIGKHLWNKNKSKIINKAFQFGINKVSKLGAPGKIIGKGAQQVQDLLQQNDFSISKVSNIARQGIQKNIFVNQPLYGKSIFTR